MPTPLEAQVDAMINAAIEQAVRQTAAHYETLLTSAENAMQAMDKKNRELLHEKKKAQGKPISPPQDASPALPDGVYMARAIARDPAQYRAAKMLAHKRKVGLKIISQDMHEALPVRPGIVRYDGDQPGLTHAEEQRLLSLEKTTLKRKS